MSIPSPNPALGGANNAQSGQIAALTAKYQKQISELNVKIKELEHRLLRSEVKEDVGFAMAAKANQHSASIEKHNRWLEARNEELENPKGSHYTSLSWPRKIIFCIRKLKRPLRFQEIIQELQVMDRLNKNESWLTEKTISVTLSGMAKDGRLKSFKIRGTRGNFYTLTQWINEAGELNEKMKRAMY